MSCVEYDTWSNLLIIVLNSNVPSRGTDPLFFRKRTLLSLDDGLPRREYVRATVVRNYLGDGQHLVETRRWGGIEFELGTVL